MEAQVVVDVASKLTKAIYVSLRWRVISEDPNMPVGTSMSHSYPINVSSGRFEAFDCLGACGVQRGGLRRECKDHIVQIRIWVPSSSFSVFYLLSSLPFSSFNVYFFVLGSFCVWSWVALL